MLKLVSSPWQLGRRAIRRLFDSETLETLARIGHGAYGLLYLLLGVLATVAALDKTRLPNIKGALIGLADLPAGWLILMGMAAGLCAFAAWRFIQAVLDLRHKDSGAKGVLARSSKFFQAALYLGIGLLAGAIALGWSGTLERDSSMVAAWIRFAFDWPLGHWIVAVVGLCAIAIGIIQFIKTRGSAFRDISAGEKLMRAIRVLGTIGLVAKGTVFGAMGLLFLIAAWRVEASAAGGFRAALEVIASVPLGDWILLAVSAGLATFGVFNLVKGWFHRRPEPKQP